MSIVGHLRFGYVVQLASLLTLALVNMVLPNWLGVTTFARLNEAYAFVGLTCMVFNEGVALLVIRTAAGLPASRLVPLLRRASLDHLMLMVPALAVVALATHMLSEGHHFGARDWGLVALTDVAIALYVVGVAGLTAQLRNAVVARLALVQGLLSFALPLAMVAVGLDVRWSIAASHLPGLAYMAWRRHRERPSQPACTSGPAAAAPSPGRILTWELLGACGATALRLVMIWLPVLVLSAQQQTAPSAAYKIALSLALGACALVPFHRQTVLSVVGHLDPLALARLAAFGVWFATAAGWAVSTLGPPFARTIYPAALEEVARLLAVLGPMVVLQVLADAALVAMLTRQGSMLAAAACAVAAAVSVAVLLAASVAWVPAATLLAFTAVAWTAGALRPSLILPSRTAAWGLLVCGLASSGYRTGAVAGLLIFALAPWLDRDLRRAITERVQGLRRPPGR